MSTELQSETSVASPPPGASDSGAADASVSEGVASQTSAPGGDTAQSELSLDTQGSVSEQAGAAGPESTTEDDPLAGVPGLDELERNQSQPYAKALKQLRTAYEARKSELAELQNKPTPAFDSYGGEDVVKSKLETYDQLFTPVIDPQTQQPSINPVTGMPDVTTAPFIERIDTENPGMAVVLAFDALNHPVDVNGQKVRLYNSPRVQETLLKAWGLDPTRLGDYRNIDALPTGVTTEELNAIPEDRREAYKTLPSSLRSAWEGIPEDERQYHLDTAQERLDAKAFRESEANRQRTEAEQQRAAGLAQVSQAQQSFVSQQLQEGYATIMDDLASKVTFSGDESANTGIQTAIGAFLFSLRDPEFRQANEARLAAMGVKLRSDFDLALSTAEKHFSDAKAYELFGQQGFKQNSLKEARKARNEVLAKLAPIALKVAQSMGAQMKSKADSTGKLLTDATKTRPVPGKDGSHEANDEFGGMLPTDPRYDMALWRQVQAQRGQ